MADSRLMQALTERVLVGDGAMGTQLVARGAAWSSTLDQLNLTQPDLVLAVHREYRAAGAEVLETNTFGANRLRLERAGLGEQVAAICVAGVRLAREAAGSDGFVLGSLGPVGRDLPRGEAPLSNEDLAGAFREQAVALVEAGVDGLVLETFVAMDELALAVIAAREVAEVPILAQFSMPDRLSGSEIDRVLRTMVSLREAGATVLGANCGFGPLHLVQAVERLCGATDAPVSAFPNASFPQVQGGRYVFSDQVEYFVAAAERLTAAGVTLLGGCCGTTPEHIAAVAARVAGRPVAARPTPVLLPPPPEPRQPVAAPPAVPALLEPLGREPVVVVELDPPRGLDYEKVLFGAQELAAAGCHAISIAENPLASIRMSSIALSYLVQREVGIPAVCHLTCRDRNLLGQQSALMGASALGVDTILALTGDPINLAGHNEAKGVFDTNSFGLVRMLNDLNAGRNALGAALERRTRFTVGVAFDPNAARLEAAVRRLEKKIALHCDFAMSQMVYEPTRIAAMYAATAHLALPIFVGLMPLVSARNARYLHNEVPGMRIPDELQQRLAAVDGDRAASQAVGQAICSEQIDLALAAGAPGIYLVTPFGRVGLLVELVQHLRQRVREGLWQPRGGWTTAVAPA
ncbi:MAG: bifunctional homocysteine S-methyltransferase/methylenetetrahydrofolate reductase [Fimbriimonadaceae bacterium]|nr:bifunctional homocysteine S-methyltransferase/methylenetetrahydrofolate reductase [Fimbriimonadaceae bacterium]